MSKIRYPISHTFCFFLLTFCFSLLLTSIVRGEDINDLAYENRYVLKAGTILNVEGNGDCLIFPYYDVRKVDGKKQVTEISVENFGEYGIAAKLRLREGARGKEVFSTDIWIPSCGTWNGRIEMDENGTYVILTSFDNVIRRNDVNNFYLSTPLSGGVLFPTRSIRRNLGESIFYGYVEVIGEEKTSPDNSGGSISRLAKTERDCPNQLKGKAFIERVEDNVTMSYDAVAIGNFSRGQGSLFRSIGSLYPRLDNCEDSLDQLEFELSKWEVYGPYSLAPASQEKTSLIITYPTKFFHYRHGSRINQVNNPFEALVETRGEKIETALSEQGQKFVDSWITLPYSVNVIGFYRDYTSKPLGIDNIPMQTFSSDLGEAALTANSLAQRILVPDYEYYQEGRFTMYRGLPGVGLVLQERQDSGQSSASLKPIEYSTNWIASGAETISTPATPGGPTFGTIGTSYTYTASGSASNFGDPIQYFFDWGDGTSSDWLAVGTTSASHTWTTGGVFAVSVRARCATHTNVLSRWSSVAVVIGIETVSAPTAPAGPSFGVVNNYSQTEYPLDKSYSYTTGGSTSSLGNSVQYFFDWGDGTNSGWLPVGTISASQTWTTGGVFTIKAMARSAINTGFVSNPSSGLVVTVESVSPPNMLSGPVNVVPNTQYTYSTGGALSNLGHQIQYFFDWGDNTNSGWLPIGTTTATKTWLPGNATNKGVYSVEARARCATDILAVSVWTSQLKVTTEWISPPSTPVSIGPNDPNAGLPGQAFTFSTGNAFSSVGHTVEYQFDWKGDGVSDLSSWGSATRSKTFTTGGNYNVRARARCVTDTSTVSDWSSALTVNIELVTVSTPAGPTTGSPSTAYTYSASGSSNTGDPVQIRFVFSDGANSGFLPVGTTSFSKTWTSLGTFTVTATARCAIHVNNVSAPSSPLVVTIALTITNPTTPTGNVPAEPPGGNTGTSYTFSTGGSTCSNGSPIEYQFDWVGDGSALSSWDAATQSKTWSVPSAPGTYSVKAKARCANFRSLESAWSSGLSVTIH